MSVGKVWSGIVKIAVVTGKVAFGAGALALAINYAVSYSDQDGEIQRAKAAIKKQINEPDRFRAMDSTINKQAESVNIFSRQFKRMTLWKDSASAINTKALVAKALKFQKRDYVDAVDNLTAQVTELKDKAANLTKANRAFKAKVNKAKHKGKGQGQALLKGVKNKASRIRK